MLVIFFMQLDSLAGKHLIVVEDLVDTGRTLSALLAGMETGGGSLVGV